MSTAIRIFVTLVCTGAVLLLDSLVAYDLQKQYASGHYPFVTGRITRSEIRSHHGRHGTSYSAYVSYTYQVGRELLYGDRLRYTLFSPSGGYANARNIVNTFPPGSSQNIFYDSLAPADSLLCAGIDGQDFTGLLFLTPFNMLTLGLWFSLVGWLRERWFKPLAGGVKIITDGRLTRLRLPQKVAVRWALTTTGALGFAALFVFTGSANVPVSTVLTAIGVVYLAGAAVWGFFQLRAQTGIYDLIIDEAGHTLSLPATYDREERLSVNVGNIREIHVAKEEHRGSKGGVSYTYAPTLLMSQAGIADQKLADWSDPLKAEDFARWLAQKLSLPATLPPEE
jgi:hypothetical protein